MNTTSSSRSSKGSGSAPCRSLRRRRRARSPPWWSCRPAPRSSDRTLPSLEEVLPGRCGSPGSAARHPPGMQGHDVSSLTALRAESWAPVSTRVLHAAKPPGRSDALPESPSGPLSASPSGPLSASPTGPLSVTHRPLSASPTGRSRRRLKARSLKAMATCLHRCSMKVPGQVEDKRQMFHRRVPRVSGYSRACARMRKHVR